MASVKLATLIDYEKLNVIKKLEIVRQENGWSIFAVLSDGRECDLITAQNKLKVFKKFESVLDEIEVIIGQKVERLRIR